MKDGAIDCTTGVSSQQQDNTSICQYKQYMRSLTIKQGQQLTQQKWGKLNILNKEAIKYFFQRKTKNVAQVKPPPNENSVCRKLWCTLHVIIKKVLN